MKELNIKLKKLGLTNQEIFVYQTLLKDNNLDAIEIATKTSTLPNAVYRTCRDLGDLGFIVTKYTHPMTFHAVEIANAVPPLAISKINEIKELISSPFAGVSPTYSPTDINLIYGADAIFEEGAKLLDSAKHEMLVISIGESIPPNLLLSVRNAYTRGVVIKMIVHKFDSSNIQILDNLKKNGYVIRYSTGSGFHIAVYDENKSLLIINNPMDVKERVAMLIESPGLSKALTDYFNSTWKKAKRV